MSWIKYTKNLPDALVGFLSSGIKALRAAFTPGAKVLAIDVQRHATLLGFLRWFQTHVQVDSKRPVVIIRLDDTTRPVVDWLTSDAITIEGGTIRVDIENLPIDLELK